MNINKMQEIVQDYFRKILGLPCPDFRKTVHLKVEGEPEETLKIEINIHGRKIKKVRAREVR